MSRSLDPAHPVAPAARSGRGQTPPGLGPVALARLVADYRKSGLPALERLVRRHGDIVSIQLLGRQALLLGHPDLVHHVLITRRDNYLKSPGSQSGRRFFGDAMQLDNGDRARRMRRLMAPLFQPDRLARAHTSAIAQATSAAIAGWHDGRAPNFTPALMDLVLDIAVQIHVGSEPGEDTRRVGRLFLAAMSSLTNFMLPDWVPTPRNRRYREAVAALDADIFGRIRACRDRGAGGEDLLSALVRLEDDDGRALSDREVRDEIVTMMSAGYQSVAIALNQTLRLVAEHGRVDDALARELDAAVGARPIAAEDLERLGYTSKIIKESLRLCPPAGVIMRRAVAEDCIQGWRIPAGARVFLSAWVLHRDGRFHRDPLAFEPERWTPELEQSLPMCAYFPFGRGPRGCIAGAMATQIVQITLATIMQRYRLRALRVLPADQSSWPTVLARGGLQASVHLRQPDPARAPGREAGSAS